MRRFETAAMSVIAAVFLIISGCAGDSDDASVPAGDVMHGEVPESRTVATWDAFVAQGEVQPRQVVFVGLDGASWDYMDQLIAEGRLPNMARIKREGAYGVLRSVRSYVSPPSWTTMMTGYLPAKTGIYTFGHWDSSEREFITVSSDDVAVPTVWDVASRVGRKVCVSNVPVTYPPHPVNGVMTTGMLTPIETALPVGCKPTRGDFSDLFVRPPGIGDDVQSVGSALTDSLNIMAVQAHDTVEDEEGFEMVSVRVLSRPLRRELGHYLFANATNSPWMNVMTGSGPAYSKIFLDFGPKNYRVRFSPTVFPIESGYTYPAELRQVLDDEFGFFLPSKFMTKTIMISLAEDATRHATFLFDRDDWDLYAFVFTQTDQMHHQTGFDDNAASVYAAIDGFVGEMMERLPSGSTMVLASDHGFSEYDLGIDLNQYLADLGVLRWQSYRDRRIDHDRTLVFHNLWHLYVNHELVTAEGLRERGIEIPAGTDPTRALLDFVAEKCEALVSPFDGRPLPLAIDVIAAPDPDVVADVDDAPDAVMQGTYDGYFVEFWNIAKPKPTIVFEREGSERFGHTRRGFFAMWGDGVERGVNLGSRDIQDIAPTLLYLMGLPVSDDMDGAVITEGVRPELIRERPLYVNADYRNIPREPVATRDRDSLEKRLRSLGYIR